INHTSIVTCWALSRNRSLEAKRRTVPHFAQCRSTRGVCNGTTHQRTSGKSEALRDTTVASFRGSATAAHRTYLETGVDQAGAYNATGLRLMEPPDLNPPLRTPASILKKWVSWSCRWDSAADTNPFGQARPREIC